MVANDQVVEHSNSQISKCYTASVDQDRSRFRLLKRKLSLFQNALNAYIFYVAIRSVPNRGSAAQAPHCLISYGDCGLSSCLLALCGGRRRDRGKLGGAGGIKVVRAERDFVLANSSAKLVYFLGLLPYNTYNKGAPCVALVTD